MKRVFWYMLSIDLIYQKALVASWSSEEPFLLPEPELQHKMSTGGQ